MRMDHRIPFLLLLVVLPCIVLADDKSEPPPPPGPPSGSDKGSSESDESSKSSDSGESAVDKVKDTTSKVADSFKPSNPNALNDLMNGPDPTAGPASTSVADNKTNKTTTGVLVSFYKYLHPFAKLFYLGLDSVLRNTKNKSLPCTITSWVPLEGHCTPVKD